MVFDVGVVRNYIKPKADSTLYNMRKDDLIEYIRTLEHNYNVAVSFNENQAKYIESLGFTGVVHCCDCASCKVILDNVGAGHWHCKKQYGLPEVDPTDFCSKGERRSE